MKEHRFDLLAGACICFSLHIRGDSELLFGRALIEINRYLVLTGIDFEVCMSHLEEKEGISMTDAMLVLVKIGEMAKKQTIFFDSGNLSIMLSQVLRPLFRIAKKRGIVDFKKALHLALENQ